MAHTASMGDFEDLIHFMEDEAVAEGPEAVAELHAFDARFRLAAELLDARRQARMTQRELAAASGVQQAEISKIERGEIPRHHNRRQTAAPARTPLGSCGRRICPGLTPLTSARERALHRSTRRICTARFALRRYD
jgi:predicted XRE-type DNA-binding protein